MEVVRTEAQCHPDLVAIKNSVTHGEATTSKYSAKDGILWYKGRKVLPSSSIHKQHILHEFHYTPIGHSGILRTYKRVSDNFFWTGMKQDVCAYIQQCDVCQQHKYDTLAPVGLLQPLPILERVWEDISMDFIKGFPISNGVSVIMVVVDRLSKYRHFVALKHPYTTKSMAEISVKGNCTTPRNATFHCV